MRDLPGIIAAAAGREAATLLLRNCRVANVFTGEIESADVAIYGDSIAGIGSYSRGAEILDLKGLTVIPSLIDAHIHIESTMLAPPAFAAEVVPRGTGAVIADPHEIANVLGMEGVRYFLESARGIPMDLFAMVPSCVPATPVETSGACIGADDISDMLGWEGVIGLAEMMNFPGVTAADPGIISKIRAAEGRLIDGHAPGLTGGMLNAYAAAGMSTDHETVSAREGKEKIRRGIYLLAREGSSERNLSDLLPILDDFTFPHMSLASDDRTALDLLRWGHMDHSIRRAVSCGIHPVKALAMATINTARHYMLRGKGAVAPGYFADLACVGSLEEMDVRMVLRRGKVVARDGQCVSFPGTPAPASVLCTMRLPALEPGMLRKRAVPGKIPMIEIVPGQIVTKAVLDRPAESAGFFEADPARDVLKLAVVERHTGKGGSAVGFARGFGLGKGAMASSVAHDSHNLIAAGVSDADMLLAMGAVGKAGGGMAFASGGKVRALLPLPVGGLMSELSAREVGGMIAGLNAAVSECGMKVEAPFAILSFLALPVIPELRLTDKGLVDVVSQKVIG